MKFLDVFVHPDREEDPERGEVAHAANLLQIGEFQLLQLAYRKAYGKDLEAALIDKLFAAYMMHGEVPSWALRYARHIIDLDNRGMLTDQDPTYIYEQLQLPEEERLLRLPEKDERQRMHKP